MCCAGHGTLHFQGVNLCFQGGTLDFQGGDLYFQGGNLYFQGGNFSFHGGKGDPLQGNNLQVTKPRVMVMAMICEQVYCA